MQEYTSSKTWKVISIILCSLFLLWLFYIVVFIGLSRHSHHGWALKIWVGIPFSILLFLLIVYTLIEPVIAKLIIGEDSIRFKGAISGWEISFAEIRGYRIRDKWILIEPLSKDRKRISIKTIMPGTDQLIVLLKSKYPDLDLLERQEGYKNLLDDSRYGKTTEERTEKLENATGASKLMNATGVIILLLSFVFKIEKYMVAVAIAAPVVFIIIIRGYNGLIRIADSKNSPYPAIPYGLCALLICLIIKCARYNILDYRAVWPPALLVGMFLVAVLMVANRNFSSVTKARIMGIVLITICSLVYGYCTVVTVNCLYDTSHSRYYRARVLDKWISRGKTTLYHFKLSRWREEVDEKHIRVSMEVYNRLDIEDAMNVYVYTGKLKIPWYVITDQ
ncbi:MAG: hypothetical protein ABWY16_12295 [Pedobacter sp.]|uniref:hypothetical protein n=1 Tax=Pedobacter sp. TaxID=1411316 RepID=UPI003395C46F